MPTTNPLRTLVDLAAIADPGSLDEAIDVALAKRLVTVEGLVAVEPGGKTPEAPGTGRADRPAPTPRGLAAVPAPSVLESRTLRLFAGGK